MHVEPVEKLPDCIWREWPFWLDFLRSADARFRPGAAMIQQAFSWKPCA
jgi:hypothetical protein